MTNRLLLASHGDLAQGLRHAALLILGERDDILATSPYSGDIDALLVEAHDALHAAGGGALLILTDLEGGSPHNALLPLSGDARVRVISGANLPLVLALAMELEGLSADSSLEELLTEARRGLAQHELVRAGASIEEEEF